VLDCDMVDDTAFIVMEYLEGETFANYVRRVPALVNDRPFALAVVAQIAQAVAAAHARGIIHRDLKPDNVFLCATAADPRVEAKVLDFGIAKLAQQHNAVHTRSGAIMGTPAYMSPEQCRGGNRVVDTRSDIYSLGCILYEALCGRRPFVRDGLGDMILAHVSEKPEPPLNLMGDLLPALDTLTLRMLAKDPEGRPQSMDDVSAELLDCLKALGVETPIADIRPAAPVVTQVRGRSNASGSGTHVAPVQAMGPDGKPGAIPHPLDEIVSGGTRLMQTGPGLTAFDEPDYSNLAPIPTTFQETTGESVRRALTSPRFRSAAMLVAVAVVGGGVGAAFVARAPVRVGEPIPENGQSGSLTITEMRPPPGAAARAAEMVTVDVRGLPPAAQVWLDGVQAAGLPLRLPRNDQRHVLSLRAAGFEDRVVEIDGRRDVVVDGALSALSAGARTANPQQDLAHARPAAAARDRAMAGPPRKRGMKRAGGKSEGKGESNSDGESNDDRDVRAITDI
jgi:protein kinase-like protein